MLKALTAHYVWLSKVWYEIAPELTKADHDRWYRKYFNDRQQTARRIQLLTKEIIIVPEFKLHRDESLVIC